MIVTLLTIGYITCFQCCALPALARMVRRGSSADLSIWREVILIAGVSMQFAVMWLTGASLAVLISPILSALNVTLLMGAICYFRGACREEVNRAGSCQPTVSVASTASESTH